MKSISLLLVMYFITMPMAMAQKVLKKFRSANMNLQVEQVFANRGIIWGFDFLPRGDIIFTERNGQMTIFHRENGKFKKINGVPSVHARGQGGLLDILLHPSFSKNRKLYFTFSYPQANSYSTTALAVARLENNSLKETRLLITAKPGKKANHHYGSRIAIWKDHIYVTVGDRGDRHEAQNLKSHLGKVLRINQNGSIPADNPFVNRKNALKEIWTWGHRNPQGLAIHRGTGQIFEQEHGPRGGDEINLLKKSANYGWPIITYGKEYYGPSIGEGFQKKGMEQPLKFYVPSIAPSGMAVLQSDKLQGWRNNLFSGALKLTHLNRLTLKGDKVIHEERLLKSLSFRIRQVKQGPDGWLYFSTDSGQLLRVVKAR